MKKINFLLLIALLIFLTGCRTTEKYDGFTKIIYNLEGGIYQNCTDPIIQYYDFEKGTMNLIQEPTAITKAEVQRQGYKLHGWYLNREEIDGEVVYSQRWDFNINRVDTDGIILYAFWKKDINYSYNVCYYDENGDIQILGSYHAEQGSKFNDRVKYADKRYGYTAIAFLDEEGQLWNDDFVHPGGDDDLTINVFVKYIKGEFVVVKNSDDLKRAAARGQNIYLAADIDLDGEEINFDNFTGKFFGNNHTISNFKIKYNPSRDGLIVDFDDASKRSLPISLFGNMQGATIQDITFENVSVDVNTTFSATHKIYVAPIAVSIKDSIIENVSFTGDFTYSRLPNANFYDDGNLIFITDELSYIIDDESIVDNCNINVTIN